jgi:tropomyosin
LEALRLEADESAAKAEELTAKVKALEQENLQKEQEITSLQHKNSILEGEVEKLEKLHGDAKAAADDSAQHGTQNEALTRKLQLLEEEAEENDKQLRETNEKYVQPIPLKWWDEWIGCGGSNRSNHEPGLLTFETT